MSNYKKWFDAELYKRYGRYVPITNAQNLLYENGVEYHEYRVDYLSEDGLPTYEYFNLYKFKYENNRLYATDANFNSLLINRVIRVTKTNGHEGVFDAVSIERIKECENTTLE